MNPNFSPPISGVVWVTGFHNSGVSTLSTTLPGCTNDMIVLIDFDGKMASAAKQLAKVNKPFGGYYDMRTILYKKKPLEVFNLVDDILEKELAHFGGHIPVLIFDNWAPIMEQALRAKGVSILPEIADLNSGQAKVVQFTWPATYEFYTSWLHVLSAKTDVTFVLTHIKNATVGQGTKVFGQYEALGKPPLDALATLKIWLIPSELYHGAPIGITFKNIYQLDARDTGNVPVWALPPRIAPCNWETIYEYITHPVANRPLEEREKLSASERDLLGGEMSPELRQAYRDALDLDKRTVRDDEMITRESAQVDPIVAVTRIQALHLNEPELTAPQIMGRLASEGIKVTIPQVIQAIA